MSFQVFQAQGLRIYAGDTNTVNSYVGLAGELAINTETKSVRILDGVTPGGVPLTTTNGPELKGLNIEQLANLLVTTPKNGEALVYQDGKWTNQAVATQSSTAASNLGELLDVTLTNLQSNQVLSYNAVLAGWENKAVATVDHDHDLRYQAKGDYLMPTSNLSELNNVQITMPEDGQSLVYDAGYQKWVNTTASSGSGGGVGSEGFKGCIIQTQHNPYSGNAVSTSQSWVDAQTVTFTPKSAKSKILIMVNYGIGGKGSVCLLRDGTAISAQTGGGDAYMFWQNVGQTDYDGSSERQTMSLMIEDEPNTTSPVTYKTQIMGYEQNGIGINPNPFRQGNGVFSAMTIFEIGDESELGGGGSVISGTSPIGMIAPFAMENAPDEWLVCDGSTLNSVANPEYADLFAAIGTTWGGTGASDFKVPDLRGSFLRGIGNGSINGRDKYGPSTVGEFQEDEFQGHYHNIRYDSTGSGGTAINSVGGDNSGVQHLNEVTPGGDAGYGEHDGNGVPRHGSETRPFNAGVLYCIKYKAASGSGSVLESATLPAGRVIQKKMVHDYGFYSTSSTTFQKYVSASFDEPLTEGSSVYVMAMGKSGRGDFNSNWGGRLTIFRDDVNLAAGSYPNTMSRDSMCSNDEGNGNFIMQDIDSDTSGNPTYWVALAEMHGGNTTNYLGYSGNNTEYGVGRTSLYIVEIAAEDAVVPVIGGAPAYSELDTDASRGATTNADNSGLPAFACRAFCTFDGEDFTTINGESHCKILASGNISKVVRHSAGWYRVYFKTPMPDNNYSPTITGTGSNTGGGYAVLDSQGFAGVGSNVLPTDWFNIRAVAGGEANIYDDHPRISIQVFR